jgi:hypothetical protein
MARTANELFRTRYADSIAYIVGLLLFFLPFVEIKSKPIHIGEMEIKGLSIKAKGIDLVKGNSSGSAGAEVDKNQSSSDTELFAVIAAITGLAAFVVSLLQFKKRWITSLTLGLLAAISMIALYFDIKDSIDDSMGGNSGFLSDLGITIGFTIWFYLSLLCFLLGAYLSYHQRGVTGTAYDLAPKNAPQLDLENPGDQSEFPKSASESEIG